MSRITYIDYTLTEPVGESQTCTGCGWEDYDGYTVEAFGADTYCPPCHDRATADAHQAAY